MRFIFTLQLHPVWAPWNLKVTLRGNSHKKGSQTSGRSNAVSIQLHCHGLCWQPQWSCSTCAVEVIMLWFINSPDICDKLRIKFTNYIGGTSKLIHFSTLRSQGKTGRQLVFLQFVLHWLSEEDCYCRDSSSGISAIQHMLTKKLQFKIHFVLYMIPWHYMLCPHRIDLIPACTKIKEFFHWLLSTGNHTWHETTTTVRNC